MKLSQHDKNFCSLMMVLEIIQKSVVDELVRKVKEAPVQKSEQWSNILDKISAHYLETQEINNRIEDAFKSLFSDKEMDLLCESSLGVACLLEKQDLKQIVAVLKAVGIDALQILETYGEAK